MNYADERYVRSYTRDTTDYLMWSWQAQALWWQLLRKFNRAGVLELGRHGLKGICAHIKMPWDVAEPALAELLEDGCVELKEGAQEGSTYLFARSYVEANEAHQSDKARQQAVRDKKRDLETLEKLNGSGAHNDVTPRDAAVTPRDISSRQESGASRVVTPSVPSVPSVPCLPSVSLSPPSAPVFDFEVLYRPYPCKEGKRLGMKTLERTVKTQAQYDSFAAALRGYLERERAKGTQPKFHKHWSTFVNQWAGIAEELADAKGSPSQQPGLQSIPSNWAEVFTLAKREEAILAEGKTPPWWSLPRRWNMTTDLSGDQLIPVRDGRAVTDAA